MKAYASQARKKLPVIQTRKIFELNGPILQALPGYRDRLILYDRLNKYLNGRRRGSLRLPAHFPPEVLRLTEMGKSQIRRSQYWVKPDTQFHQRLPKALVKWLNQVAPGQLWSSTGNVPVQTANSVAVPRLNKRDVPRISRPLWPSVPSFTEMMHMSRSGKKLTVQDNFRSLTVFNCLTPRDVHERHDLATRIVRRQIIGIRYEMEVPRKFLKYFRYRDGFLILTVRHCLPIGLVRFLLSKWITCYTSLWLVQPIRFKYYLRRFRFSDFIRDPGPLDATIGCEEAPVAKGNARSRNRRARRARQALDREFDQAMLHRFGLNPALF